jgi:hypothetical protein
LIHERRSNFTKKLAPYWLAEATAVAKDIGVDPTLFVIYLAKVSIEPIQPDGAVPTAIHLLDVESGKNYPHGVALNVHAHLNSHIPHDSAFFPTMLARTASHVIFAFAKHARVRSSSP